MLLLLFDMMIDEHAMLNPTTDVALLYMPYCNLFVFYLRTEPDFVLFEYLRLGVHECDCINAMLVVCYWFFD
jgi:hypothetical protein